MLSGAGAVAFSAPGCVTHVEPEDAGTTDAGHDAGIDAGYDAGIDAGYDAGTGDGGFCDAGSTEPFADAGYCCPDTDGTCPLCCFNPTEADGGPAREDDGGFRCLC